MVKYQEFLHKLNIASEKDFNKIAEEFNFINIEDLDLMDYCTEYIDLDELAKIFISAVVKNNSTSGFIDELDYTTKEISLWYINTLEELNAIKNKLPGWVILNEDEIIRENEKDKIIYNKMKLISDKIDNIPIEDLKEFVSKYND